MTTWLVVRCCYMRKLIFGNWKANKSESEVEQWLAEFTVATKNLDLSKLEPVIAPPYPFLFKLRNQPAISVGVQDISPFSAGSYTGAIAALNLKNFQVKYTLVGHSERRKYFMETAAAVSQKITQALINGIKPIVCVDETTLDELIAKVDEADLRQCLIAYEPVASIGTGNNAPLTAVKTFAEKVKEACGEVPYLYGGSINENNIAEYLLVSDGVIIGGASLSATQFVKVLKAAQGELTHGS